MSVNNSDLPAGRAEPITPSDSASGNLATITRGVYIGVAGNITVVMAGDDSVVLFAGVAAGSILPIRIKRVNTTATSASGLVGLY